MEGGITDPVLRPLPPRSLGADLAEILHGFGSALARRPARLSDLLDGEVPAILTSASEVPADCPPELLERAVGFGDRRDVLLGAGAPLGQLAGGTEIRVRDLRSQALLRAHHPELRPDRRPSEDPGGTGGSGPEIRPLWDRPSLETRGEVLEGASWLPSAGQGIGVVMVHRDRSAAVESLPDAPGATDVLAAERRVARAFPGWVVLVRGWTFRDWLGLHAVLLSVDGRRAIRADLREQEGPGAAADRIIERLLSRGADRLADRKDPTVAATPATPTTPRES